jgi:hypothetical protein
MKKTIYIPNQYKNELKHHKQFIFTGVSSETMKALKNLEKDKLKYFKK